ncbi:MAG: protein translocase subunit SecF [Gammaproteobacteria bacterium]|uniref:Protein-export membrane protein SecF n=1 Tax=SAR86 cluster bacterium TaxID=2030880 RepID=A0A520N079_9GAMM|nr:protein translocase subunit SecF [Gammaproteobacteria bacterium]MBA4729585.1 protein translocase subunit SecF [SAR86 cluster bacterium]RZO26884.1 MAG: protein translocase subunit SecF [SAR86 cluster bacterium]|tara:strand:- start:5208 stop:6122 length:915 start_codon:yes stop_codon:yes gene_type:complete
MMNIPFTKYNNLGLSISSLVLLVSLVSILFKGLNYGLDFTGGVSLEIKYNEKADLERIRGSISKIDDANFLVLNFGSDEKVLIKFQSDEELNINADTVIEILKEDNYLGEVVKSETIFPQIGEELRDKGGIAILVAIFAILIYIIFRFQIKFGYGAIAALVHDVLIILGVFSLFNLTFDLSVLAAILAIVGYSLNDSIVVSDRIRENFLDKNSKGSPEVLINTSLNQVFARTIITSFTTLLVLTALLIAGGSALFNFSLALSLGVIIGSYSSIFIVVGVLLKLNLNNNDMDKPKNEPEESYSLD